MKPPILTKTLHLNWSLVEMARLVLQNQKLQFWHKYSTFLLNISIIYFQLNIGIVLYRFLDKHKEISRSLYFYIRFQLCSLLSLKIIILVNILDVTMWKIIRESQVNTFVCRPFQLDRQNKHRCPLVQCSLCYTQLIP